MQSFCLFQFNLARLEASAGAKENVRDLGSFDCNDLEIAELYLRRRVALFARRSA